MFSKTTEYALRAVIYIAQNSTKEKMLGLNEIARGINSPQSFTAKILQKLTPGNKIISSLRGPHGGFYISSKAQKLPLRAILEAVGEDAVLKKCVLGLKGCSSLKPCPLHDDYKEIRDELVKLFEKKTIKNLVDEMNEGGVYISRRKI